MTPGVATTSRAVVFLQRLSVTLRSRRLKARWCAVFAAAALSSTALVGCSEADPDGSSESEEVAGAVLLRAGRLIDERSLPWTVTQSEFQDDSFVLQLELIEARVDASAGAQETFYYQPLQLYRDSVSPVWTRLDHVERLFLSFRDEEQTVIEIETGDMKRYIDGALTDEELLTTSRLSGLTAGAVPPDTAAAPVTTSAPATTVATTSTTARARQDVLALRWNSRRGDCRGEPEPEVEGTWQVSVSPEGEWSEVIYPADELRLRLRSKWGISPELNVTATVINPDNRRDVMNTTVSSDEWAEVSYPPDIYDMWGGDHTIIWQARDGRFIACHGFAVQESQGE